MNIEIEGDGLEVTESIRFHVEERLAGIRVENGRRLGDVMVRLKQRGSGRNRDYWCSIEIDFGTGAVVRVEERARSVWQAVDRCSRLVGGIAHELVRRIREGNRPLGLGRLWG